MANDTNRKEKLAIWLCKVALEDRVLLKLEDAKAPLDLKLSGGTAKLYVKRDRAGAPPPWTRIFTSRPDVPDETFGISRTVGAVLVVVHSGRKFALSFGSGFHLLQGESVERDFGMRVALNAIDPRKLRSVDKASYDNNPLNSRTQSTTEVDIFELQMNTDLDMLYAVTGSSRVPELGSQVTGRDALTLMVETNLDGILAILEKALELYNAGLPAEFAWFDNVRKVKDADDIFVLDMLLDDALASKDEAVWLGEPEIVDWEAQHGYSFDLYPRTPRYAVLQLSDLADYLRVKGRSLCTESLRSSSVHANDENFKLLKEWSAYRCLYAELSDADKRYILRNGTWYQIDQDFVASVDRSLAGIEPYGYAFPIYDCEREEHYNEAVSKVDKDVALMDQRTIPIGGSYDKIEFCDLLRNGTDLIHVKYYRSSGTLSHLFAQGYVAAEAFVADLDFRVCLNHLLPVAHCLADPKMRPDASRYRVVYAIATTKALPGELPFFSKVTLRNAVKTLRALGFEVSIAAISVDPDLLAKKKYKPSTRARSAAG